MGIELKLSDRELPASPAFIRFLDHVLSGKPAVGFEVWPDQLSEELMPERPEEHRLLTEAAERVMRHASGRARVARAYTLFVALLTGDMHALSDLQSRFRFINIIGVPRTGGSYLTAEIYRALGVNPHEVPGALAHDSFPEAGPFVLGPGFNSWAVTLKTTAEYLTMVELFFAGSGGHSGKIIVPKKLTQAVYAAGLFRHVFGPESDYVLTVRHPTAACVSTYEKSGGLPEDGRFRGRSNIERWCRRDLENAGWEDHRLDSMDYFDAYLRYWELYHLRVATAGLSACSKLRIVPYGAANMHSIAQQYHDAYGSGLRASGFQISATAKRRHPDWVERARPSLQRVQAAWSVVGLAFPANEIAQCE